jgi:hypothetical protein
MAWGYRGLYVLSAAGQGRIITSGVISVTDEVFANAPPVRVGEPWVAHKGGEMLGKDQMEVAKRQAAATPLPDAELIAYWREMAAESMSDNHDKSHATMGIIRLFIRKLDEAAAETVGTLPTLNWSTPDDGTTWIVTFGGSGVVGGSIANGVYDITLDDSLITPVSGDDIMSADAVTTFYRLFGSTTGDETVCNMDKLRFNGAFNNPASVYTALFDYFGAGIVDNADKLKFNTFYNTTYSF